MERIRRWHVGSLAGMSIAAMAIVLFAKETIAPSVYGVCTVGYNYREQPIYWFGVSTSEGKCGNDVGGRRPGAAYSGGGGVACGCAIRPGEQATVKWTFDQPLSEIKKHVPEETHQVQVTVPQPESRKSRYLQVHFLSDNRVVFDWRDDFGFSRVNSMTGNIDEQQH